MLSSSRLKTTLLIIAVIAAGFGLYAVFHALDAYGHGIAISKNSSYDARVNESTTSTTYHDDCPANCGTTNRGYTAWTTTYDLWRRTDHYHLSTSGWVYQYTTGSYVKTVTERGSYWENCPNSSCGG